MTFYRRHLPHWQPPGRALFVTWRLYGSLPLELLKRLRRDRRHDREQQGTKQVLWRQRMRREAKRFRLVDRLLDRGDCGPLWLRDPRVARSVVETLGFCERELQLYALHAYVVMANHIHVLLTPKAPLATITRTIKTFTARKGNEFLSRRGQPFWQDESFDHWVRDEAAFSRIVRYIEWNPVQAGLVRKPEDWPWSSACRR